MYLCIYVSMSLCRIYGCMHVSKQCSKPYVIPFCQSIKNGVPGEWIARIYLKNIHIGQYNPGTNHKLGYNISVT